MFKLKQNRLLEKLQRTSHFTQAPQAIQRSIKVGSYAGSAFANKAELHKFMFWKPRLAAEKSETLPLRALA